MIAIPMSPPAVIAVSTDASGLLNLFNHHASPSVMSWSNNEVSSFGQGGFDPAKLNRDAIARSALSPNPGLGATILRYIVLQRLISMVMPGHSGGIPGMSDQTTSLLGSVLPNGGSSGGGALGSLGSLTQQRQQTLGGLGGFLNQGQSTQASIISHIR